MILSVLLIWIFSLLSSLLLLKSDFKYELVSEFSKSEFVKTLVQFDFFSDLKLSGNGQ